MKHKVISRKNFPARLPVYQTLAVLLTLDFYNAAQWVWGAIGLLFLGFWIVAIMEMIKDDHVDIFKKDGE